MRLMYYRRKDIKNNNRTNTYSIGVRFGIQSSGYFTPLANKLAQRYFKHDEMKEKEKKSRNHTST